MASSRFHPTHQAGKLAVLVVAVVGLAALLSLDVLRGDAAWDSTGAQGAPRRRAPADLTGDSSRDSNRATRHSGQGLTSGRDPHAPRQLVLLRGEGGAIDTRVAPEFHLDESPEARRRLQQSASARAAQYLVHVAPDAAPAAVLQRAEAATGLQHCGFVPHRCDGCALGVVLALCPCADRCAPSPPLLR